jgi:hypothetical protein
MFLRDSRRNIWEDKIKYVRQKFFWFELFTGIKVENSLNSKTFFFCPLLNSCSTTTFFNTVVWNDYIVDYYIDDDYIDDYYNGDDINVKLLKERVS